MINYKILVNKSHSLDKDFVPKRLVDIFEPTGEKIDSTYVNKLNKRAYRFFKKMQKDARDDGYLIYIDSSYRTFEYQKMLFDDMVNKKGLEYALKSVAKPGCSEHQTGLAIDILFMRDGVLIETFEDEEPELEWVKNNCYKYGYILRYPKGKEDITGFMFEPWHFRFVGKRISKKMHKLNIETFEEYIK